MCLIHTCNRTWMAYTKKHYQQQILNNENRKNSIIFNPAKVIN